MNEAISTRDDVMNFLIHRGMDRKHSFFVMENVRKGKGIEKRNKQGQATTEFEAEMRENNIPEWFIESCKKNFLSIPTGPCSSLRNDGFPYCLV